MRALVRYNFRHQPKAESKAASQEEIERLKRSLHVIK
jgi:hypothetical protein